MNQNSKKCDLVFINGNVITVDQHFTIKPNSSIGIKNQMINYVGTNDNIKKYIDKGQTIVIDLKGKTIMPGINDTHIHAPFFGATRSGRSMINLEFGSGVKSIKDMVRVLEKRVSETKEGEWIRGFGWQQTLLSECQKDVKRLPRKYDLDIVSPNNPVVLIDFSAHTMVVNSKALEIAGIDKDTPNPPSGILERDPKTGEPTGILIEFGAQDLVADSVPILTRKEKKEALLKTLKVLRENGVTSFTDGAIGPGGEKFVFGVMSGDYVNIYKELYDEKQLTARVSVLLLLGNYGELTMEDLKNNIKNFKVPQSDNKDYLKFDGVKIFGDGIPPTKTSWMVDEYVGGGTGSSVIPGKTEEEQAKNLTEMIEFIHSKGYQLGIHCTGDKTCNVVTDGFERAINTIKFPNGGEPRHYIIHGDFLSEECARKLQKCNCGVSAQPFIKTIISDFIPSIVGEKRGAYEWPLQTIMKSGCKLSSSSDSPITYPNPFQGIHAAVLRKNLQSGIVSGVEECLTVEQAIQSYTINGAWFDHMEDKKGSIEVGKYADLCVIDRNILTINPSEIDKIKVLMTVVNGNIVYDKITRNCDDDDSQFSVILFGSFVFLLIIFFFELLMKIIF